MNHKFDTLDTYALMMDVARVVTCTTFHLILSDVIMNRHDGHIGPL